jgi:hypothetical protein
MGGVVKDERGQPLDGIRVLLSGSDYRGFSMGNAERRMHEYAELWMTDPKSPPPSRTNPAAGPSRISPASWIGWS